jgi:uncharacterized protein with HEPN domain
MEKDPGIYVRHILEAIANIEADTAGYDFGKFRVGVSRDDRDE